MDYQKFVEQAIGMLESEKVGLINQGIRAGSIVAGTNGAGRIQHHWVVSAKRRYIPQKLLPTYRSEIERSRLVDNIDRRVQLLRMAMV